MDNAFQKADIAQSQTAKEIHEKALKEFDDTVALLKSNRITVIVFNDNPLPTKPDAVYAIYYLQNSTLPNDSTFSDQLCTHATFRF